MQPFKIQIELGQYKFSAEGEEATVKEQLSAFMAFINKNPTAPAPPTTKPIDKGSSGEAQGTPPVVLSGDFEKVFIQEADSLHLRIHPESKNGNKSDQAREAFVLTLYGHKKVFNREDFTTIELAESLRKSGIQFERLGFIADSLYSEGKITKTGKLKGTRYRITQTGITMAERIIEDLRSRF